MDPKSPQSRTGKTIHDAYSLNSPPGSTYPVLDFIPAPPVVVSPRAQSPVSRREILTSVGDPITSPVKPKDVKVEIETKYADMAVAHRNMMQTSCTIYDPVSSTFKWRPIISTSRDEIGDYGVGLQLYFDFLHKICIVLLVMAVLCTPLLVFCYQGNFAGLAAGIFAKLTIGNIKEHFL